jgi:hypothetical protein
VKKPLALPSPSTVSPVYGILPKKSVQERLNDAKDFLRAGKDEIQKGRGIADKTMIREGCEKVFHAFVEAAAARIQKYGLGVPESHEQIREGLIIAGPPELLKTYENAFSNLHVLSYYRGWFDNQRIDASVREVEKGIEKIEKLVRK